MAQTQFDPGHEYIVRSAHNRLLSYGGSSFSWGLSGLWKRRPLVLCALCLFIGDLIGLSGGISLDTWYILAITGAAFAVFMLLIRRPKVWQLLICMTLIGGMLGSNVITSPAVPDDGEYFITGRLRNVINKDDYIAMDIDHYSCDGVQYEGLMRLYLYRSDTDDILPDFEIGMQVSCFGNTYIAQSARGEGGFDYRGYLMRRNVYVCASSKLVGTQLEHTGQLKLLNWFYQLRLSVMDSLDKQFDRQSATARGIMLGDSASMPEEMYDAFQKAGLSHILAVSGMHISAIILLLTMALRVVPGKIRSVVILLVLILYCGITDFSISVMRASIMGAIMVLDKQDGIRYDGLSALSLSAVIILALKPGAALDTGFALTYGAVIAIYTLYPGLNARILHIKLKLHKKPKHKVMSKPAEYTLEFINLTGNWLINSLILSICVTLGLLPLTSAYFGRINLAGLITSAVGILSGMGVLYAGWLCVLTQCWAPHIAAVSAGVARICACIIEGVAQWTAGLEIGVIYMRTINAWWLMAFVPLIIWASRYRPLHRKWRPLCSALACILLIVLLLPSQAGEGIDYVMVDVGQADGTLFTDGASAVVIDVGKEDSALCDYIRRRGLKVNALIITHLHSDHAGALEEVVQMTCAGRIYLPINAENGADEDILISLSKLRQSGIEVEYLSAGDLLEPIEGLKINVLHPSADSVIDDSNDYSLVIRAEYAGRSLLLCGDLTTNGEDFQVEECDVLKVAHHGSASSSSLEFLAGANPHLALISVSAHNSYGLPKQSLLKRLEYVGTQVLTTADYGDITVHISPNGSITARTYLMPSENAEGL